MPPSLLQELTMILGNQAGFIGNWDKPSGGPKQSLNIFFTYTPEEIHTSSIIRFLKVMKLDLGKYPHIPNKESRICQF